MSRLVQIHPDLVVDAENVLSIMYHAPGHTPWPFGPIRGRFSVRVRERDDVIDYSVPEIEGVTIATMLAQVRGDEPSSTRAAAQPSEHDIEAEYADVDWRAKMRPAAPEDVEASLYLTAEEARADARYRQLLAALASLRAEHDRLEREVEWYRGVIAEEMGFDGPAGDAVNPLRDWLQSLKRLESKLEEARKAIDDLAADRKRRIKDL